MNRIESHQCRGHAAPGLLVAERGKENNMGKVSDCEKPDESAESDLTSSGSSWARIQMRGCKQSGGWLIRREGTLALDHDPCLALPGHATLPEDTPVQPGLASGQELPPTLACDHPPIHPRLPSRPLGEARAAGGCPDSSKDSPRETQTSNPQGSLPISTAMFRRFCAGEDSDCSTKSGANQ